MRVNANAVLRSWTLLAAFGGSYAPDIMYMGKKYLCKANAQIQIRTMNYRKTLSCLGLDSNPRLQSSSLALLPAEPPIKAAQLGESN